MLRETYCIYGGLGSWRGDAKVRLKGNYSRGGIEALSCEESKAIHVNYWEYGKKRTAS